MVRQMVQHSRYGCFLRKLEPGWSHASCLLCCIHSTDLPLSGTPTMPINTWSEDSSIRTREHFTCALLTSEEDGVTTIGKWLVLMLIALSDNNKKSNNKKFIDPFDSDQMEQFAWL